MTAEEAWEKIHPVEQAMDEMFGTAIWGKDDDTFEGRIADLMIERQTTLSSMESCTAGLFASTICDVAGASEYFKGGMVTYQTQEKINAGVSAETILKYGVYSQETARGMAEACRAKFQTDYAIGITGVVGNEPVEGTDPGTIHIAVDSAHGPGIVSTIVVNQGRQMAKRRAVTTALLLLRRSLLGPE
jgi:PncC family amidohydrolase